MSNLKNYDTMNIDEIDAVDAELNKGAAFMKLQVGENVVRFVPKKKGSPRMFHVVQHHYIDDGSGERINFNCPRLMAKQDCPACARAAMLDKSGNARERAMAQQFWPRKKIYACVIDRNAPENGVQVIAFGAKIWDQLKALFSNKRVGGDFSHPLTGYDIIIERSGTGMQTDYKVFADRNQSVLAESDEDIAAIVEEQPDLERYTALPSLDDIAKHQDALLGGGGQVIDASARRALPASSSSSGSRRGAAPSRGRSAQDDAIAGIDDDD